VSSAIRHLEQEMLKLNVPDMTCGHCVGVIEKAIKSVDAKAAVKVDLASKTVTVETAAAPDPVSKAVDDAGYPNTVA
jgi:copper chaperone